MTGFASLRRPIGAAPRHALIEFAVVRVGVTCSAVAILETERQDLIGASGGADFVTSGARHGRVGSSQRETRVAMFGDCKSGAVKILNGMTIFAFVQIRRGCKLSVMGILVAVGAGREVYFIDCVLSCGQMALVACNGNVFALQRVFGCVVLFHAEKRGFPPLHSMTFRAFAFLGTRFELAFVRVRFMTIIAILKRQGLFEITLQVAFRTADLGMLSEERVLRLRMVELKSQLQFFPSRGGVAFFAALLEGAFMRIDMAVDASIELHVPVASRTAGHIRLVALLAGDLNVKSRQRIAGLGVIEQLCGFPVRKIMTSQTIVSELAFVHILVARYAILRQPEKRLRKILHLEERAFLGNHVSRHVAFLAREASMLSFQVVASQAMIKLFLQRLPVDQIEVFAVMLQMAADTVLAIGVFHMDLVMIAMLGRQPLRDFFVALQALEGGRAGPELVAACALGRSRQRLVCLGERAG